MEDRRAALPAELVDHNALVGPFPFRRLPDPTPERLVADQERLGIARLAGAVSAGGPGGVGHLQPADAAGGEVQQVVVAEEPAHDVCP